MRRFIFVLNHPAHYHLFKYIILELQRKGNNCDIYIRPKDVLIDLMEHDNFAYKILPQEKKSGNYIIINSIKGLLLKCFYLYGFIKKNRPDLMIGTDWAITILGKLLRIPSIVFNEDDTKATPENKFFYPFAKTLVLPESCDIGLWSNKRVSYSGNHEIAYLHPNRFKYDKSLVANLLQISRPYIIIRLVKLTASHDIGKRGLGFRIIEKIIDHYENSFNILISAEGEVHPKFNKYLYKFNPVYMHQFLAGANLVLGDSQTMIAEAAVLGTPAIRFNDFVGKLSYLSDLENIYELSYGYTTDQEDQLFQRIDKILGVTNIKQIWKEKRSLYFKKNIDLTSFSIWFIENYPESFSIMKSNPDYQYNFR